MIHETCSCGARFESDTTYPERAAAAFRAEHKCIEPVTLAEVRDSGPGMAEVIEAVDRVALLLRFISDQVSEMNETPDVSNPEADR